MYDKRIAKDINVDESLFERVMNSINYDEGFKFMDLILMEEFELAKKRFESFIERGVITDENAHPFDELEECAGCNNLTNEVLFDDLCPQCSDF